MKVISGAFKDGDFIPKRYTCDGVNISPPIAWENIPENTKSLSLICEDPDAPIRTWVHWVLFNIPYEVNELKENIPPDQILKNGSLQGINDFNEIGYGGPCPPSGIHRYFFKIYALDARLNLKAGITKREILKAMEGHILAEAELMARYIRE